MKELVVLDLDGVIINGQSQQIFLNFLFKKGLIGPFFYLKLFFWFIFYKLGLVKNPQKIMAYAYNSLKNKEIREVNNIIDEFFDRVLKRFIFIEIIDIIEEHRACDRELIILSNSADILVKRVADFLDIKNYIGTNLEIINEKFTGKILGDIVYGKNKAIFLKEFIKKNNLNSNSIYAYADHISDLGLFKTVSHPYAVNPDKILLSEAQKRNWPILIFKKKR